MEENFKFIYIINAEPSTPSTRFTVAYLVRAKKKNSSLQI